MDAIGPAKEQIIKLWNRLRLLEREGRFAATVRRQIEKALAECWITSVLRDADYAYYTNLQWPKKARRDSKYGILFRGCFAHIIDVLGSIPNAYDPKLQ